MSDDNLSIYSDAWNNYRNDEENNNDVNNIQINFNGIDLEEYDPSSITDTLDNDILNCDSKGNEHVNNSNLQIKSVINNLRTNTKCVRSNFKDRKRHRNKNYVVAADLIEDYFDFLPNFIKSELCRGPFTKCENVQCRSPIFDFVTYEFCLG